MRRLLLLSVGSALGLVLLVRQISAQSGDTEFGVLKTSPAAPLPAGVEPLPPAGSAESAAARPQAPPNPFPLTAQVGPWLICAAHYSGFDGAVLAHQVALELRNKHHCSAFIFNRAEDVRRQEEDEWQKRKAMYPPGTPVPRRRVRIQDDYAVLVGGFPDFAAASNFLPNIKKLPLPTLKLDGDRCPYDTTMPFPEVDPQTKKVVYKQAYINPFQNAMVVRNPLTPSAGANKPKWDPLWKKFNADEEYSLLKNRKAWTLIVKEYSGRQVIVATGVDANASGKPKGILSGIGLGATDTGGGESLNAAAAQAHELARFLRNPRFGYEAWVLHTRTSSVVTVGGFTGPDDPALQQTVRQLTNLRCWTEKAQADPIGLLANPIPIEVPRP